MGLRGLKLTETLKFHQIVLMQSVIEVNMADHLLIILLKNCLLSSGAHLLWEIYVAS